MVALRRSYVDMHVVIWYGGVCEHRCVLQVYSEKQGIGSGGLGHHLGLWRLRSRRLCGESILVPQACIQEADVRGQDSDETNQHSKAHDAVSRQAVAVPGDAPSAVRASDVKL